MRRLCLAAWLLISSYAAASDYSGQVTLGALPVSGAVVTVVQGDKTSTAITDAQGVYDFHDLADGACTVQVQMTGFSAQKKDVTIAPGAPAGMWELQMLSLEQIRAQANPTKVATAPVVDTQTVAAAAKKPAEKPKAAAAQVASAAQPEAPAAVPSSSDVLLVNGSVNNANTSQFAQSAAFGNTRNGKGLYNGGLAFTLDNSALDARQYSITGIALPKPTYDTVTGEVTLGGPLNIPHLMPHGPNFFVLYRWLRSTTATTQPALVPNAEQRQGILSTGTVTPVGQAEALLQFYPLPNLADSSVYNYEASLLTSVHQDSFQAMLNKSLNSRHQLNGRIALQSTRISSGSLFGFVDKTDILGTIDNINWVYRFKPRMLLTSGYTFSRQRTQVTPYFQNRENVTANAGIQGSDQDPSSWGPPTLNFSSGIYPLSDGVSAFNRAETNLFSESLNWSHLRHYITIGEDFRRQEFNYLSQQNPQGTFTFTGQAVHGSDFQGFLEGIPDTTQIAFGNADKYLRQSVYDAFISDDWRVMPQLTITAGMRWEYGAPMTELHGRLVNLDVAPGFANVTPVLASNPIGALTGQHYPTSLIRQDKVGFEPRLGLAWKPLGASSLLLKFGYGIYDDTSVYQATALNMAQQAPLSKNFDAGYANCAVTFASGFNCPSTDTFAIDPNFRVGYAQVWNASLQRDLPGSLQLTATYQGTKGTRGVQEFLPNTYANGAANPCPSCPSGFAYRTSNGNSEREAGIVQLRRRLHSGLTATLQYTFSKSIDDDYSLGGQGPLAAGATSQSTSQGQLAQNWLDLRAERSLSTFDQRHLLNAQVQYTTGMGIAGNTLMSGWRGAVYKDWTFQTTIVAGSGLPETPVYSAVVTGTGITGSERPNRTSAPLYVVSGGHFLNPAAFTAPAAGMWGNAGRDSITGPDQLSLNASMARTFRLKGTWNLDGRVDATNFVNHVTYSGWNTTYGSPLFGAPASANGMRTMKVTLRLRF